MGAENGGTVINVNGEKARVSDSGDIEVVTLDGNIFETHQISTQMGIDSDTNNLPRVD